MSGSPAKQVAGAEVRGEDEVADQAERELALQVEAHAEVAGDRRAGRPSPLSSEVSSGDEATAVPMTGCSASQSPALNVSSGHWKVPSASLLGWSSAGR